MYTQGPSGKIYVQLVPPDQYDAACADRDHNDVWNDDELQAFLDEVEEGAGFGPANKVAARTASEEWELHEMRLRSEGVKIPIIEEHLEEPAAPAAPLAVGRVAHAAAAIHPQGSADRIHRLGTSGQRPAHWRPRAGRRRTRGDDSVTIVAPPGVIEPCIEEEREDSVDPPARRRMSWNPQPSRLRARPKALGAARHMPRCMARKLCPHAPRHPAGRAEEAEGGAEGDEAMR